MDNLYLSALISSFGLEDSVSFENEQPFNFFARATSNVSGKKCIFLQQKKYIKDIDDHVSMVITTPELKKEISRSSIGLCLTKSPRSLFFEIMSRYEHSSDDTMPKTIIGQNCSISKTAVISPNGVIIGDNVYIGEYVVIHPGTTIGNNVTIQTGSKIGEQDFNLYTYHGATKQLYHKGKVQIGSNVLISSGVLVGRALYTYGITSIGDNCSIGPNVGIGHNTIVESGCEICAKTAIGGFCEIGHNVTMFMSVTVANGLKIGANSTINVGSVIIRSVPNGKTMFGNPAREILSPPK